MVVSSFNLDILIGALIQYIIKRNDLFLTFSSFLMSFSRCGSQTWQAYSRLERTNVLYATSLVFFNYIVFLDNEKNAKIKIIY